MLKTPIYISGLGSVSALGSSDEEVWKAYESTDTFMDWDVRLEAYTARLTDHCSAFVTRVRASHAHYESLDPSVLYAITAARQAVKQAGWQNADFGINIGSSRGATHLFEQYHKEFLQSKQAALLSSPGTTLGNIATWVAQDLQSEGPAISHSITCSTALHALLNGVSWLTSGMATQFMVGGTEAALTPFTIAQMRALKLTPTRQTEEAYPCRALDFTKKHNTMVLGEGAAMICLERNPQVEPRARLLGIGYATERLQHPVSLSSRGICFQKSMQMALSGIEPASIDAVVLHAPGTVKGDEAEVRALEIVFDKAMPALTTNKWKLGHTFGASGMLSLEMAVHMLERQAFITVPYSSKVAPATLKRIMINAVGFGGNAVSVILERVS